MISGGDLGDEFFRRDDATLEGALEDVLSAYAEWTAGSPLDREMNPAGV